MKLILLPLSLSFYTDLTDWYGFGMGAKNPSVRSTRRPLDRLQYVFLHFVTL